MKRSWLVPVLIVAMVFGVALPPGALAVQDATPPSVDSFSISPGSVDTASADRTVTITATFSDAVAGVATLGDLGPGANTSAPTVYLHAPSGTQYVLATFARTSGTAASGTYQAEVTLPKGATPGAWYVSDLFVTDKLGNQLDWHKADLEAAFGAGVATVTNTASTGDSAAPAVTSLVVAPHDIDTGSDDEKVTVTMTITDGLAGVSTLADQGSKNPPPSPPVVYVHAPSGTQYALVQLERTSGTDLSGTYVGETRIPKGAAKGTWYVSDVFVNDKVGNQVEYDRAEASAAFGLTNTTFVNHAATADSTAPVIEAFEMTPGTVDTGSSDQEITVTVRVGDAQAGVATAGAAGGFYPQPSRPVIDLYPLLGTQSVRIYPELISGDANEGVYRGTATLPAHSKEGLWYVSMLYFADKLGNVHPLATSDLAVMFPTENVFVANTAEAQNVTVERQWSISTTHTIATFAPGTVITRADTGSFPIYQMVGQEFQVDGSIPETDLAGTPVATLRVGIPGIGLTFSQPVAMAMHVGSDFDGYILRIQSLSETGTAWGSETQTTVSGGWARFTVTHATYYAATVKSGRPVGSIKINNGSYSTRSRYVTLYTTARDPFKPMKMRFSNNGKRWTSWRTYTRKTYRWSLTNSRYGGTTRKGTKYVYVQYANSKGVRSLVRRDAIRLR